MKDGNFYWVCTEPVGTAKCSDSFLESRIKVFKGDRVAILYDRLDVIYTIELKKSLKRKNIRALLDDIYDGVHDILNQGDSATRKAVYTHAWHFRDSGPIYGF